jgi:hypothetical protein
MSQNISKAGREEDDDGLGENCIRNKGALKRHAWLDDYVKKERGIDIRIMQMHQYRSEMVVFSKGREHPCFFRWGKGKEKQKAKRELKVD